MDKYSSISELASKEQLDRDYRIFIEQRAGSSITIVAPHGGMIEPGTSEIAKAIAGLEMNCYCFEGIKQSGNYAALHVASHRFDDKSCLDLLVRSRTVITVHGCIGDIEAVYLGGLEVQLIARLMQAFREAKIPAYSDGHDFPGVDRMNVCNRGMTGKGAQLEITRAFRKGPRVNNLVSEVRQVLLASTNAGQ